MVPIFANPTLVNVLTHFFMNPHQEFYQAAIVKETGNALIQVQRSLKVLEHTGMISSKKRGRMVFYQADRTHPAFDDLKRAFLKTVSIGDDLRTLLRKHHKRADLVWIFGSVARGEENVDSDIDLIFISKCSLLQMSKIVGPISRKIKRELNAVFLTPDDLVKKYASKDYFISDIIQKPKIWLIGNDQELRELLARTSSQTSSAHS